MKNFKLVKKFVKFTAVFSGVVAISVASASASIIAITGGDDLTNVVLGPGGVTDLTGNSNNLTPDFYLESTNNTGGSFLVNNIGPLGVLQPTGSTITPTGAFDVYYVHQLSGQSTNVNGSVSFARPILGVAASNGLNNTPITLTGTSGFQVPGVLYNNFPNAGILENSSSAPPNQNDLLVVSGNSLSFTPTVFGSGANNFRIFVESDPLAVPEPTSFAVSYTHLTLPTICSV